MKTNFDLSQNYIDLGFRLSDVGGKTVSLRYQDNLVFTFVSDIDAREGFVSRLCDYHLKLAGNGKIMSRN